MHMPHYEEIARPIRIETTTLRHLRVDSCLLFEVLTLEAEIASSTTASRLAGRSVGD